MKRNALFVVTNLAVVLALGALAHLFGLSRILDEHGGLDLRALLLGALLFGMGGSSFARIFSTHPPLEARIDALRHLA